MNIFQKQTVHKRGGTILLSLLLSIAVFLSSLCVATWSAINNQFSRLEQGYTTYAIQSGKNFGRQHFDVASVENASAYTRETDQRILLSAHVEEMTALPTGKLDYMEYIAALDNYCHSFSVAALECVDIELLETNSSWMERTVTFRVVDWVSRSTAYEIPPYEDLIQISTDFVDEEGNEIFEIGKTYLVRGFYQDYPIYRTKKMQNDLCEVLSRNMSIFTVRFAWK